jgi:ribosomal protein L37AE/L43A
MRIWTNRYRRDLARYSLALRMLSHEARLHTIVEWTGLSRSYVRRLYTSYATEHAAARLVGRRGPSPCSVYRVLNSQRWRAEAAAAVGVCYMYDVLPTKRIKNARSVLPTPERGERLCRAFEMYRAVLPEFGFDFEELVFLVMTVAQGTEVRVSRCEDCGAVILSGRYTGGHWHCTHCDGGAEEPARPPEASTKRVRRAVVRPQGFDRAQSAVRSLRRARKQTH